MSQASSHVDAVLVDEQAHELRDRERRMRVVQLRREQLAAAARADAPLHARAARSMSCSEQETKKYCCARRSRLPRVRLVVRVEHLASAFSEITFSLDRAVVVADVEVAEVERLDRLAAPQPQRVARVDAIARDRDVARDALDAARRESSARAARPSPSV